MKKLVIIILAMLATLIVVAQDEEFRNIRIFKHAQIDSMLSIDGDTIRKTTQIDADDDTLITLKYFRESGITEVDPVYANDSANVVWFFDLLPLQDSIKNALDTIRMHEDSIAVWSASIARYISADDTTRWGEVTESDSTIKYVTPTQLTSYIGSAEAVKNVFSITLPYSPTVAGRVSLAVEGVDYPSGWILTGDGLDLVVNHGLGRWVSGATVFAKTTGTVRQQLFNTAAYNGVSALSDNEVRIYSISTIAKDIVVYLTIE